MTTIISSNDQYDIIVEFPVVTCKKNQMQNNLLYTTGSSIYPGEYVPLFKENDFNKIVKHFSKNKVNSLPLNIKELENSYKIELAVPGVKRENLFLKIYQNDLFISVIHNDQESYKPKGFQLHEFNFDRCFARKIVLPHDADPLFVSAEYKAGILHLHVPKSTRPVKRIDIKIAIY